MESGKVDKDATLKVVEANWDSWFIPGLSDFVRVPNLTPMVDAEYLTNGLVEKSMECVDGYINKLGLKGLSKQTFKSESGLPLVCYIVEPTAGVTKNVMVYGHLDKQPYGTGWFDRLSPTEPTIEGDLMYGRGASDDGYAPFSCMLAVKACQEQGVPLPRVCLVLETEEESGSPNLVALLKVAEAAIGVPDACFCMDSGAFDYEQLWITSSLRGICILDVTIQAGETGYHSGEVGGIVPETFRILRQLLDRLDDPKTGKVIDELHVELPAWKKAEAEYMAKLAGPQLYEKYAVCEGGKYCSQEDIVQMYLNNVWCPNMSITGADGLPPIAMAGNVVRASTGARVSMRLPPAMDPKKAEAIIRERLTTDVPYNAKVTLAGGHAGAGWCMKELVPWLDVAIKEAGAAFYNGKETGSYGMGGSIPFLSELEKMFPATQIVAFGLLGPNANAHGPNEMIHLPYAKKLTCSLAHVLAAVGQQV